MSFKIKQQGFTRELRHLYYFVKIINEILVNSFAEQKSIDIVTKNI